MATHFNLDSFPFSSNARKALSSGFWAFPQARSNSTKLCAHLEAISSSPELQWKSHRLDDQPTTPPTDCPGCYSPDVPCDGAPREEQVLQVPGGQSDQAIVRYPWTATHVQQLQLCTTLEYPLHKVIADSAGEGGDRELFQFWETRGVHLELQHKGLVIGIPL